MSEQSDEVMVPAVEAGRLFTGVRRVRLGDVDPSARLRLDALTRYAQDVSNDDTGDAELEDEMAWVVRRTTVDVRVEATFGETLTLRTFAGRLGARWADRRISVHGDRGAHYEMSTLWIHVDPERGRPKELSEQFLSIYGAAAAGRTVSARLQHPKPETVPDRSSMRWPLRAVDFDIFDHMNNAAYWAVVEQDLRDEPRPAPLRATVEYGAGIAPHTEVIVERATVGAVRHLWFRVDEGQVPASASLEPLSVD